MHAPTASELDGYVGKHISEICGNGLHKDADNHCAHFVCHITQYTFGLTCHAMTGKGDRATSGNIRVQEVFRQCVSVGKWADKPAHLKGGFIFTTKASNVNLAKKTMDNVPKKHIGIFIENDVWQYKNKRRQVIKQTPEDFKKHYGTGYETFYGEFPL